MGLSVAEGWCTVREESRYSDEEAEIVEDLKILQNGARDDGKGIWSKEIQVRIQSQPR